MNSNSLIIPELDKNITNKEKIETINKLKNNKAHGDDLIINEMLKAGNQILIGPLNRLFNNVLSSGTYPDTWCTGTIIPIYKSGDKENPSNYRRITVSNCLGKLFNTILNKQIVTYLETNKLLSDTQLGFRPGRRTTDHIFLLKTIINKYKHQKSMYMLVTSIYPGHLIPFGEMVSFINYLKCISQVKIIKILKKCIYN